MKTEVKALFKDFNAGEKKDVLKFELKGDLTDAQLVALHKLKGGQVFINISSSQMDLDDIDDEEHEGVEYSVNGDGTVDVAPNQLSIDDVPKQDVLEEKGGQDSDEGQLPHKGDEVENEPAADPYPQENVADIEQERKRRGRPKKAESETVQPEQTENQLDELPTTSDDDLPF
ncbi:hypothetical protein P4V54_09105 [Brevibacillus nitrificans]|uniref:hypothetical protein n=1 Tax=Brevibacillus nitrificans TaxID=651560 RepID=UPI002E229701|nr:hypothetical protein [Brevibacillus nitrificans]